MNNSYDGSQPFQTHFDKCFPQEFCAGHLKLKIRSTYYKYCIVLGPISQVNIFKSNHQQYGVYTIYANKRKTLIIWQKKENKSIASPSHVASWPFTTKQRRTQTRQCVDEHGPPPLCSHVYLECHSWCQFHTYLFT